jgi:hypothetical protein
MAIQAGSFGNSPVAQSHVNPWLLDNVPPKLPRVQEAQSDSALELMLPQAYLSILPNRSGIWPQSSKVLRHKGGVGIRSLRKLNCIPGSAGRTAEVWIVRFQSFRKGAPLVLGRMRTNSDVCKKLAE